jgi:hypothetical protein
MTANLSHFSDELNVIRGLDPRIHLLATRRAFLEMDRRVKPGDDAG